MIGFLRDLARQRPALCRARRGRPARLRREQLALADPQPWDWPHVGEKLKEARYAFSEQEVKQYFQAPKVLQGCSRSSRPCSRWRSAATRRRSGTRRWSSTASKRARGQLVGQFYLDPRPRGKRGGAWMDDVRARWLRPTPASCKRRWRTWCFSPTAWMANRRC